ncbi:MAG: hypothetical protein K9L17_09630 [Clostridiales bacterium]|nr:hypothetical protein [Clostridiales bacterium]
MPVDCHGDGSSGRGIPCQKNRPRGCPWLLEPSPWLPVVVRTVPVVARGC